MPLFPPLHPSFTASVDLARSKDLVKPSLAKARSAPSSVLAPSRDALCY